MYSIFASKIYSIFARRMYRISGNLILFFKVLIFTFFVEKLKFPYTFVYICFIKIFSAPKIKYKNVYTCFYTFFENATLSADIIRWYYPLILLLLLLLLFLFHSVADGFSGNMSAKSQPLKLILFYFILFYLLTK